MDQSPELATKTPIHSWWRPRNVVGASLAIVVLLAAGIAYGFHVGLRPEVWSAWGAWVQAVGALLALAVVIGVNELQNKRLRDKERQGDLNTVVQSFVPFVAIGEALVAAMAFIEYRHGIDSTAYQVSVGFKRSNAGVEGFRRRARRSSSRANSDERRHRGRAATSRLRHSATCCGDKC